jgi:GxxExxY protein
LGPGFDEKIYEEAMIVVLNKYGHVPEQQKRVDVFFQDVNLGFHKLDLVVDGRVILELKSVSEIAAIHKQQALSYLKASGLQLALVINFGAGRLQVARVVNTKQRKINAKQVFNQRFFAPFAPFAFFALRFFTSTLWRPS